MNGLQRIHVIPVLGQQEILFFGLLIMFSACSALGHGWSKAEMDGAPGGEPLQPWYFKEAWGS